ncbi:DUF1636 family protein [Jannaschia aquimarina]|uniref:Metal-binding protein n=1 Tax=Jannaschia aquimarina TaxID=935700 RepID=A0A0D1D961_9RHOB|nr:DUF1636 domain-containing protein [Jannaschia aquimarina]KIT16438.1 hypothetical protein jaqu_18250 [Jannaschia aquimarina]SNS92334.1 Predicted metal-binding protein [Jannaschia aquimarina]
MLTTITVCDTCKREGWNAESGQTDGEILASLIERAADGLDGITVRRHSCLMGCSSACNVALQADGKMAYTLGGFDPTSDAADGIVEYASLHAREKTGIVAYRDWPEAINGHFVTRHPPLPDASADPDD